MLRHEGGELAEGRAGRKHVPAGVRERLGFPETARQRAAHVGRDVLVPLSPHMHRRQRHAGIPVGLRVRTRPARESADDDSEPQLRERARVGLAGKACEQRGERRPLREAEHARVRARLVDVRAHERDALVEAGVLGAVGRRLPPRATSVGCMRGVEILELGDVSERFAERAGLHAERCCVLSVAVEAEDADA